MRLNRNSLIALAAVAAVFVAFFAFETTTKTDSPTAAPEAVEASPAAGESDSAAPTEGATPAEKSAASDEAASALQTPVETEATPSDEFPATPEGDAATIESATPASDEAAESTPPAPAPSVNINVEAALEDRIMGNATAPLTLIEYASMTCPHCAEFNTTILPRLKKDFIETGKLKLVYRDLPTDAVATKAAMMARCAPADQYFNVVETIYSTQQRWIQGTDITANLSRIGTLAGMDQPTINACIENEDLRKGLLRRVEFAQNKWYFTSTPSFVLQRGNYEETFKGVLPYEEVAAKLNKLLSN